MPFFQSKKYQLSGQHRLNSYNPGLDNKMLGLLKYPEIVQKM